MDENIKAEIEALKAQSQSQIPPETKARFKELFARIKAQDNKDVIKHTVIVCLFIAGCILFFYLFATILTKFDPYRDSPRRTIGLSPIMTKEKLC